MRPKAFIVTIMIVVCIFMVGCTSKVVDESVSDGESNIILSIIPGDDQSPVNLSSFPIASIRFSVSNNNLNTPALLPEDSQLYVFEDNQPVTKIGDIKMISSPISLIFFFDMGPEGKGKITETQFKQMTFVDGAPLGIDIQKLLICSTKDRNICTLLFNPQADPYREETLHSVYEGLMNEERGNIPAGTVLPRVIAISQKIQGQKVVVVVKNWLSDSITYLPQELLSSEVPIILINLAHSYDPEGIPESLESLVKASGGYYFVSGEENGWDDSSNGLYTILRETIIHNYQISYYSHLFHDTKVHKISLVYKNNDQQTWDSEIFSFHPLDNSVEGNLRPSIDVVALFLMIIIPILLVAILIVIDEENVG